MGSTTHAYPMHACMLHTWEKAHGLADTRCGCVRIHGTCHGVEYTLACLHAWLCCSVVLGSGCRLLSPGTRQAQWTCLWHWPAVGAAATSIPLAYTHCKAQQVTGSPATRRSSLLSCCCGPLLLHALLLCWRGLAWQPRQAAWHCAVTSLLCCRAGDGLGHEAEPDAALSRQAEQAH